MIQSFKILRGKPTKKHPDFREKIANCNDDELKLILRRRKYYQPEASAFAIEEAIRRGLINSENELSSEDFRQEDLGFRFFPPIQNPKIQTRVRRSIARSLVIAGIIPVVYGFMEMNRGAGMEGRIIAAFGFLWIFFAAQLNRMFHRIFIVILLLANFAGGGFVAWRLTDNSDVPIFDYFILGMVFVLICYGLLFVDRIHSRSRSNDLQE